MHPTIQEVERFYTIWFPLLHYVNQQRNLVPSFPRTWRDANVAPEDAVPLRDTLWEDDGLRKAFIAENPANLSQDDLTLVESWQHRVSGNFFIFRHLKKYTIFISGESPVRGYGVLGLTNPIEEILGSYLPIYVKAVLLPFEGRIIYDSLLTPYSVYFGGGYRSSLKDTYREIQERGGVITSLLPGEGDSDLERVQFGNKKMLTAFQKGLGKAGLSPKMIQEHTSNLAHFADLLLLEQNPPGLLLDITREDLATYLASQRGKINLVSFKRFARFLRDTARVDYEQAEDLLALLKDESRR